MAPFYEYVAPLVGVPIDKTKLQNLKTINEGRLAEIEKQIKDAEENLSKFYRLLS